MAGRAHKRLLQEQLGAAPALAEQPPSEEASESGSDSEDDAPTGTVFNPFSLLTDDEVREVQERSPSSMSPPRCSERIHVAFLVRRTIRRREQNPKRSPAAPRPRRRRRRALPPAAAAAPPRRRPAPPRRSRPGPRAAQTAATARARRRARARARRWRQLMRRTWMRSWQSSTCRCVGVGAGLAVAACCSRAQACQPADSFPATLPPPPMSPSAAGGGRRGAAAGGRRRRPAPGAGCGHAGAEG